MRTISPFEFARLVQEERETPYFRGNDYLDIHEDKDRSFECEFTTYTEYDDDWYCQVIYEVTLDYSGRDSSNHEVAITEVYVNSEEVQLTDEQERELTTLLTKRANVEYQFNDTEGLYPDLATSYTW